MGLSSSRTGLGAERAAHRQLQREDGVRVAVAYAVASPVESPDVVLHRSGAEEVTCQRRTAGHEGGLGVVEGLGGGEQRLVVGVVACLPSRWRRTEFLVRKLEGRLCRRSRHWGRVEARRGGWGLVGSAGSRGAIGRRLRKGRKVTLF